MIELDALAENTNADPKRIEFLAGEIANLRAQLAQKRMDYRDVMQKKFGPAAQPPRRGAGPKPGITPPPPPAAPDAAGPGPRGPRPWPQGPHHGGWHGCPYGGWMMEGADWTQLPANNDGL